MQERKKQLRGQRFAQTTGPELVHAKALPETESRVSMSEPLGAV